MEGIKVSHEPLADVRDMYMAHVMFRREIGLAAGIVGKVPGDDAERATIVADHVLFVGDILDHHHRGEDEHLWPRLLARGGDRAAAVVAVMNDQHAAIDKAVTSVRAQVQVWRDCTAREGGPELTAALSDLSGVLDAHMAVEEEQALPLVERHITAAEWGQMLAAGASGMDADQMALVFGMMCYEADPIVVRDIVAALPAEVGPAMVERGAEAFARHAEKVYGTATPPRVGGTW